MADARRYDSMGFESANGIWVRAVDYDALAAELEKSVNNARGLWIDRNQQARRIAALETELRGYKEDQAAQKEAK